MTAPEKQAHTAVTPGPWWWRLYANEPEDVERARALGIEPVRMLTNDGQVALMAGQHDDTTRVALIDCQTHFKRGHGHKTECAERDANARLIAEAGTVAHETGLTPRQLAERLAEFLAELQQCKTELEEAANLLRPQYQGIANIYQMAAARVGETIMRAEARP